MDECQTTPKSALVSLKLINKCGFYTHVETYKKTP